MGVYLGLDIGTQSAKAELIDVAHGTYVGGAQVNYGKELPRYASPNGYLDGAPEGVFQADPLMWLEAVELLLLKLQKAGMPMAQVKGISGAGQQHGSVYLRGAVTPPEGPLCEQYRLLLARPVAPIWMDHSTVRECGELTARFGARLQLDTGSPATPRFAASQILRFRHDAPEQFAQTKRIHLISSFVCSVLIGQDAPIDTGDGAGMNLLNLHTMEWDEEICEFVAPGLLQMLPPCVPGATIAGGLASYFERYGLKAGTPVVAFTGDNPSSLAGMGATRPGTAVISLGTSDTFFGAMPRFMTDPNGCGNVFGNPGGGFMSLICFANGSLAREQVKTMAGMSWEYFDGGACDDTLPGNNGRLMLPYFVPECTPPVAKAGVVHNRPVEQASPAEMARCIMESQALSMRYHAAWQGKGFERIRVTGGASRSLAFRQILANVFQAPIESMNVVNSSSLGAALRAANGVDAISFDKLADVFSTTTECVQPQPETFAVYERMLEEFATFESEQLK